MGPSAEEGAQDRHYVSFLSNADAVFAESPLPDAAAWSAGRRAGRATICSLIAAFAFDGATSGPGGTSGTMVASVSGICARERAGGPTRSVPH